MYQLSDEEILEDFQGGNVKAAGLLYEKYKGKVMAYFFNNTRSKQVSEDLLQITFERLLKYATKDKLITKFKPYFFAIARNVLIDYYHKSNKVVTTEWKEETVQTMSQKYDHTINTTESNLALLHKALAALKFDKRELISMVKLNGMLYQDAAIIYKTTEANIKVKVFRIMKELKEIMAELQAKL